MNLYLRELDNNKKGLIIWSIILVGLIVLLMAFYPTIAEDTEDFEAMIESMPKGFMAAFGIGELSLSSIFGYYALEGYLFVTLLGSIYATMLSSSMLAKEEGDKTIEFLLSKPISRNKIVTAKLLSYLTNIIIFNVIVTIGLFISFQIFKENSFSMKTFILISIAPFFMHLIFGAIGFLISVFLSKNKRTTSISLGVVLVTYFLGILSEITEDLEFLKHLSPFKYFEAKYIIPNNEIQVKYVVVMLAINIICIGLAYGVYRKKDMTI